MHVTRRQSAVSLEQSITLDLLDHRRRLEVGQRKRTEGDVLEQLDVDPTQTERQQRPERWILRHPDQDFVSSRDHLLDQNAFRVGDRRPDLLVGFPDLGFTFDVEKYSADVGLVQRRRRQHFDGDGPSDRVCNLGGFVGTVGRLLDGKADPEGGQHVPDLMRLQPTALRPQSLQCLVDYIAGGWSIDAREFGDRTLRNLEPLAISDRPREGLRR